MSEACGLQLNAVLALSGSVSRTHHFCHKLSFVTATGHQRVLHHVNGCAEAMHKYSVVHLLCCAPPCFSTAFERLAGPWFGGRSLSAHSHLSSAIDCIQVLQKKVKSLHTRLEHLVAELAKLLNSQEQSQAEHVGRFLDPGSSSSSATTSNNSSREALLYRASMASQELLGQLVQEMENIACERNASPVPAASGNQNHHHHQQQQQLDGMYYSTDHAVGHHTAATAHAQEQLLLSSGVHGEELQVPESPAVSPAAAAAAAGPSREGGGARAGTPQGGKLLPKMPAPLADAARLLRANPPFRAIPAAAPANFSSQQHDHRKEQPTKEQQQEGFHGDKGKQPNGANRDQQPSRQPCRDSEVSFRGHPILKSRDLYEDNLRCSNTSSSVPRSAYHGTGTAAAGASAADATSSRGSHQAHKNRPGAGCLSYLQGGKEQVHQGAGKGAQTTGGSRPPTGKSLASSLSGLMTPRRGHLSSRDGSAGGGGGGGGGILASRGVRSRAGSMNASQDGTLTTAAAMAAAASKLRTSCTETEYVRSATQWLKAIAAKVPVQVNTEDLTPPRDRHARKSASADDAVQQEQQQQERVLASGRRSSSSSRSSGSRSGIVRNDCCSSRFAGAHTEQQPQGGAGKQQEALNTGVSFDLGAAAACEGTWTHLPEKVQQQQNQQQQPVDEGLGHAHEIRMGSDVEPVGELEGLSKAPTAEFELEEHHGLGDGVVKLLQWPPPGQPGSQASSYRQGGQQVEESIDSPNPHLFGAAAASSSLASLGMGTSMDTVGAASPGGEGLLDSGSGDEDAADSGAGVRVPCLPVLATAVRAPKVQQRQQEQQVAGTGRLAQITTAPVQPAAGPCVPTLKLPPKRNSISNITIIADLPVDVNAMDSDDVLQGSCSTAASCRQYSSALSPYSPPPDFFSPPSSTHTSPATATAVVVSPPVIQLPPYSPLSNGQGTSSRGPATGPAEPLAAPHGVTCADKATSPLQLELLSNAVSCRGRGESLVTQQQPLPSLALPVGLVNGAAGGSGVWEEPPLAPRGGRGRREGGADNRYEGVPSARQVNGEGGGVGECNGLQGEPSAKDLSLIELGKRSPTPTKGRKAAACVGGAGDQSLLQLVDAAGSTRSLQNETSSSSFKFSGWADGDVQSPVLAEDDAAAVQAENSAGSISSSREAHGPKAELETVWKRRKDGGFDPVVVPATAAAVAGSGGSSKGKGSGDACGDRKLVGSSRGRSASPVVQSRDSPARPRSPQDQERKGKGGSPAAAAAADSKRLPAGSAELPIVAAEVQQGSLPGCKTPRSARRTGGRPRSKKHSPQQQEQQQQEEQRLRQERLSGHAVDWGEEDEDLADVPGSPGLQACEEGCSFRDQMNSPKVMVESNTGAVHLGEEGTGSSCGSDECRPAMGALVAAAGGRGNAVKVHTREECGSGVGGWEDEAGGKAAAAAGEWGSREDRIKQEARIVAHLKAAEENSVGGQRELGDVPKRETPVVQRRDGTGKTGSAAREAANGGVTGESHGSRGGGTHGESASLPATAAAKTRQRGNAGVKGASQAVGTKGQGVISEARSEHAKAEASAEVGGVQAAEVQPGVAVAQAAAAAGPAMAGTQAAAAAAAAVAGPAVTQAAAAAGSIVPGGQVAQVAAAGPAGPPDELSMQELLSVAVDALDAKQGVDER